MTAGVGTEGVVKPVAEQHFATGGGLDEDRPAPAVARNDPSRIAEAAPADRGELGATRHAQ